VIGATSPARSGSLGAELEGAPTASAGLRWTVLVGATAFLLLTNFWTGSPGNEHPWGADVVNYHIMFAAAPHFPDVKVGSAYTARWVPHYLLGLFSYLTSAGFHTTYRLAWAVCLVSMLVVLDRILVTVRASAAVYCLAACAFILDPYSLRGSVAGPGGIQDFLFIVSLGVLMWGLLARSFPIVLVATVVGILARQSELPVAPVTAVWMVWGPGWRDQLPRQRWLYAGAVIGVTAVLYAIIELVSSPFSFTLAPKVPSDTILPLFIPSGSHYATFAAHIGRVAVPLLVPGAMMVAALLVPRLVGQRLRPLPLEFYGALLVSASVVFQPLVISPHFPGFAHNEQRLAGLGLLPFCVALALSLRHAEARAGSRIGSAASAWRCWRSARCTTSSRVSARRTCRRSSRSSCSPRRLPRRSSWSASRPPAQAGCSAGSDRQCGLRPRGDWCLSGGSVRPSSKT
jgi:hypothetical protein